MTSPAAPRILAAVLQILVTRGIEDVTIRHVAAAAEVSIGAVQHHHPTKDALLQAAMDEVTDQFLERVTAAVDPAASARQNLETFCRILGGVDDESRSASIVWLAFASKAATSDAVARAHQDSWRLLEAKLTVLLQQLNPRLGPDDAATLMALLDGIAIARALEPERMPAARAALLIAGFLRGCEL